MAKATYEINGTTLTWCERNTSRKGVYQRSGDKMLTYWVQGTDSELDIENFIANVPPRTFAGYLFDGATYEPHGDDDLWFLDVHYRDPSDDSGNNGQANIPVPPVGEAKVRFGVSGVSEKTDIPREKGGLNETGIRAWGTKVGVPLVWHKFIGQDKDGTVAGTEVLRPQFSFAFDYTMPKTILTRDIVSVWSNVVGKINEDIFFGFDPGTCLCTSITGEVKWSKEGQNPIPQYDSTMTFEFSYRPNKESFTVGDIYVGGPSSPAQRGWDYLDLQVRRELDDNKVLVATVDQAIVWEVYEETVFSVLGIPGTAPPPSQD